MVIQTDKKLKKCPFCHGPGRLMRDELWTSGGHGYRGNYDYYAGCCNSGCKINPITKKANDIYQSPEMAIDRVVNEWNKR